MAFRPMGEEFENAQEDVLAPPGEYNLECISMEEYSQEGGREGVKFSFKITDGEEDYPPLNVWLDWPPEQPLIKRDGTEQTEKAFRTTRRLNGREWRRAAEQFEVPMDGGLDPDDFVGKEAVCEVIVSKDGKYNNIVFRHLDADEKERPSEGKGRARSTASEQKEAEGSGGGKDGATRPRRRRAA